MAADQPEKELMRDLIPDLGDEQEHVTAPDIDGAMHNAVGVAARDRDRLLLSAATIAIGQRWRLADDRFIQHQRHRPFTLKQTVF